MRTALDDLTVGIPIPPLANQTASSGARLRDEAVIIVRGAVRNRGSEVELGISQGR